MVKTDEPGITHKSDVGGVRLGLGDPGALAAAYDELAARLGPRVLVCETAAPGTELALGIARDPSLGPLLVVSAGGVLIEIFAERAVVLAPVTRLPRWRRCSRLRLAPVLAEPRPASPPTSARSPTRSSRCPASPATWVTLWTPWTSTR